MKNLVSGSSLTVKILLPTLTFKQVGAKVFPPENSIGGLFETNGKDGPRSPVSVSDLGKIGIGSAQFHRKLACLSDPKCFKISPHVHRAEGSIRLGSCQ
ncbi:MAG: hypothetical protein C75L2_00020092 [Leptospirillum sp. Group II 'C75']|nr:MAG: hypothetical protein C75L2_00020092 [Leptospirillum sp. Group II 'C75']